MCDAKVIRIEDVYISLEQITMFGIKHGGLCVLLRDDKYPYIFKENEYRDLGRLLEVLPEIVSYQEEMS